MLAMRATLGTKPRTRPACFPTKLQQRDLGQQPLDFRFICRRNVAMSASVSTQPRTVAVVGTRRGGLLLRRTPRRGRARRALSGARRGFETVREKGITITSHLGDLHLPSPTLANTPEELGAHGTVDWLIVALESYDLDQLPAPSEHPCSARKPTSSLW